MAAPINLSAVLVIFLCFCLSCRVLSKVESKSDEKWKKKDVRDYTDADLERLFDQWEVSGFDDFLLFFMFIHHHDLD